MRDELTTSSMLHAPRRMHTIGDTHVHVACAQDEISPMRVRRYEISLMRDELHSFLFHGGSPRVRTMPAPITSSHSQSDEDEAADEADEEDLPEMRSRPASARSSIPSIPSRPSSARPRSGGPAGRAVVGLPRGNALNVRRPSPPQSAQRRVDGVVVPAAEHELPHIERSARRQSPPRESVYAEHAPTGSVPPALRARPPSGIRPGTADRRSPRVRMAEGAAAVPPDPHFSCTSIATGTASTTATERQTLQSEPLAFAQRNHFAMQLPPIS